MRFAFGHGPTEHYSRHIDLVREAEQLGFDVAWIPDRTFHRDPYVVLGSLALSTGSIALGLAVTNPYTRHPAINARAMATVAEMTDQPVYLGLGAGNRKELVQPLGLETGNTTVRTRESLQIMRGLLRGEELHYRGEWYRADGVSLAFRPERPVPVYLACRGPRLLEMAGALADGAIIGALCTKAGMDFALEHIKNGAARAGRSMDDIEVVSWVTCEITADRPSRLDNLRPAIAHVIGGAPVELLDALEPPSGLLRRIKQIYWQRGTRAAGRLVTDECADAFSIVGTAAQCRERIAQLAEAGVGQFSALMPPGTVEEYRAIITTFSERVISTL